MTPLRRPRFGFSLLASLLLAAALHAAEGGFTATLSLDEKSAAGITTLSADERNALDLLVADDLAFARREKLTALDGTFVSRLSEASRKSAGLDRLSPEQLAKLNELVAAAIAARPQPKERPRLKDKDVLTRKEGQVHGSVTVGYGWGSGGRVARFGSFAVNYTDPSGRFGLGLGLSTFDGDGFWGYYPGYYTPGYYYPGFYDYYPTYSLIDSYGPRVVYVTDAPRTFLNASYRFDDRTGGFAGDGACFRGSPGGSFAGRGGVGRRQ
jgi:hypothetical protein